MALSQLSYGPARSRVAKRFLHRFAGETESMGAHTIPAAAAGMLFMLAGALIVAVLLVYFALGVADAD